LSALELVAHDLTSDGLTVQLEDQVRHAIYRFTARTGAPPRPTDLAQELDVTLDEIASAYDRLAERRLLVLESDGFTIRMAPPFSGVPTQHVVRVGAIDYFANCAWDALGIPAALRAPGEVRARCEQSREPLRLPVSVEGPGASDWLFHCEVPAVHWWRDIVFT
jgi:hypothetical protein